MARLSLLAVLVFCLMGQVECDSRSSSRDHDGQNHENEMCKPVLDELLEIKGILKEINDLGIVTATMQLSQTQPEETQSLVDAPTTQSSILGGGASTSGQTPAASTGLGTTSSAASLVGAPTTQSSISSGGASTIGQTPAASTGLGTTSSAAVAECSACGKYETCNQITFECELKRCGSSETIDLFETNITTTYAEFETFEQYGEMYWAWNATETDNYIQINFSDMSILEAFSWQSQKFVWVENVTIETFGNCENFTDTLTLDYENFPGDFVLPEPVLARCVRFYPVPTKEFKRNEYQIQIIGCSAQKVDLTSTNHL